MDRVDTLKVLLRDYDITYMAKTLRKNRVVQFRIPYHISLQEKDYSKILRDKSYLRRILESIEYNLNDVQDNGKEWVIQIPY